MFATNSGLDIWQLFSTYAVSRPYLSIGRECSSKTEFYRGAKYNGLRIAKKGTAWGAVFSFLKWEPKSEVKKVGAKNTNASGYYSITTTGLWLVARTSSVGGIHSWTRLFQEFLHTYGLPLYIKTLSAAQSPFILLIQDPSVIHSRMSTECHQLAMYELSYLYIHVPYKG